MAVITGSGVRNASIIATTPVTVCIFAEEIFRSFIEAEGFTQPLSLRWSLRSSIMRLPQFSQLSSTVLEKVSRIAHWKHLQANETMQIDEQNWYMLSEGTATCDGEDVTPGSEFGGRPFAQTRSGRIYSSEGCAFISIPLQQLHALRREVPQLNYTLRKQCALEMNNRVDWALGLVKNSD